MNNFKKAAFGLALSTISFAANAQKNITEGVITYNVSSNGQVTEAKNYFKADSSSYQSQRGPVSLKVLTNDKTDYLIVLIDVPVAGTKKAAVASPADLEQMKDQVPTFTATQTSETQTIAGYKCKKVQEKENKSGSIFDVWVTNDVTAPSNTLTKYFTGLGGFPVKFSTLQMGQKLDVTLKSISAEKVKPGTFTIPAGFDKITFDEMKSLGGGRG